VLALTFSQYFANPLYLALTVKLLLLFTHFLNFSSQVDKLVHVVEVFPLLVCLHGGGFAGGYLKCTNYLNVAIGEYYGFVFHFFH
jgi:hypothetical protein